MKTSNDLSTKVCICIQMKNYKTINKADTMPNDHTI